MPVARPTFSESWYRVSQLRPKLRGTVQVHRQHYRGQMWHVLEDPGSNDFSRLSPPAYEFIALLDGRRTVADAWDICNDTLGDSAPTQGEVIQLLGQLYTSNLLRADLPPDAEGLLKRYRKRKGREVRGYLMNLLFARLPLIDPDRFLDRWVWLFGKLFTPVGLILWAALLAMGLSFALGDFDRLLAEGRSAFSRQNLLSSLGWLYVALIVAKICHEFGHAFAVKRYGRVEGHGGEVHTMGVMFLVFAPLPYVDASSAWAFRNKWHRVVVGAAGMMTELAIASLAAMVWAHTAGGSAVHAVCFQIMFIASVSSLMFNANPLLRFDGYYILSDLLEIPNLHQRSREYLYYLVRKYAWGVRTPINPAHSIGERIWFVVFAVASTAYRLMIFVFILLFLTDRLPRPLAVVAIAFGLLALVTWLLVPIGKFIRYLATSGELGRTRSRAVASTLIVVGAVVVSVGAIPVPDRVRVEGVVEPVDMAFVFAEEDGFLADVLPSGAAVRPGERTLVCLSAPDLHAAVNALDVQRMALQRHRAIALSKGEAAEVQKLDAELRLLARDADRLRERLEALAVTAPVRGTWIAPDAEDARGLYVRRGERVGLVGNLDRVVIRAVVTQANMRLIDEAQGQPELRVRGRPEDFLTSKGVEVMRAAQKQIPSAALGYAAGGPVPTDPTAEQGTEAGEHVREVIIYPDPGSPVRLLVGQRVVARFEMPPKPLAAQWWRSLLGVLQERFKI